MKRYKILLAWLLGVIGLLGGSLFFSDITKFFEVITNGTAMLPPKYLSVADFQKCLAAKDMGTWQAWCTPAKKPDACLDDSWKQLSELTGKDRVPKC